MVFALPKLVPAAQLEITDVQTHGDMVILRWALTDDAGANPKNGSGEFSANDQSAIDAALKRAIQNYGYADTIKQSYAGKVVSLDNKGAVVVNDKPTITPPPPPPPPPVIGLSFAGLAGSTGGPFSVSILFDPAASLVASLQFDIPLPSGVTFNSAKEGSVVTSAGKQITTSLVAGALRVIIFGINQNAIQNGALADISLSATKSGSFTLQIKGVVASDANGNSFPLASTDGVLIVS